MQENPSGQPQLPPHPLLPPHVVQRGVHVIATHVPPEHIWPVAHAQPCPQPSSSMPPQAVPQRGTHAGVTQTPLSQFMPVPHGPHDPVPQLLGPHVRPLQLHMAVMATQRLPLHTKPAPQPVPQDVEHPVGSAPHSIPTQHRSVVGTHIPPEHICPLAHGPLGLLGLHPGAGQPAHAATNAEPVALHVCVPVTVVPAQGQDTVMPGTQTATPPSVVSTIGSPPHEAQTVKTRRTTHNLIVVFF